MHPSFVATKGKVSVYIGSLGDKKKGLYFRLSRLHFFLRYNPFLWNGGLCLYDDPEASVLRRIIISLSGPVFSLMTGIILVSCIIFNTRNGFVGIMAVVFIISVITDFFRNIIPNKRPIKLEDGTIAYNDGQNLKTILSIYKFYNQYNEAAKWYNASEYKKSIGITEKLIALGDRNDFLYKVAALSYLQLKDYNLADGLLEEFIKLGEPLYEDYYNMACVKEKLGLYAESFKYYDKAIEMNPDGWASFNNKGYTYNIIGEYEKAIIELDKAIILAPEEPFPYNNRGLARLKTGKTDEGYKDIQKSLMMDSKNSYAYRNLGIYYFDRTEYAQALENFNQAHALDSETPDLEQYLLLTRGKMNMK